MHKPTQALKSVKDPDNTFDLNLKWARTLPSEILHGIFIKPPHPQILIYRSWHLTPCCGFEVQKSTHALKSVKSIGNTFDLNPKWARTLPSGILPRIFIEPPSPIILFYRSWHVTPCCGLKSVPWVGFCTSNPPQGGLYKYPMYNSRRQSSCPFWGLNQRYCASPVIFPGDFDGGEHVYRVHPINVQL